MRTALVLLLLLALAAVPGSLVPQRTSDPNGVIQYEQQNPDAFKVLDSLGVFETFGSPWFSAIYLLLFISLVGCVVPRTKHHFDALRARPPKTPARLQRLVGFTSGRADADAATAVAAARSLLRRQGYRVEARVSGDSVSAERGYLRETGNLIFHSALVGILVTVALGGSFGYTGQKVIVQDTSFTNVLTGYDSFNPGRFFDEKQLVPYSLRLDEFTGEYQLDVINGKTAAARLHGRPEHPHAGRRVGAGDPQGQLAAGGRRHQGLSARQRLRADHHRARPRRGAGLQRRGAVPPAGREPDEPRGREGSGWAGRAAGHDRLLLPRPGRARHRRVRLADAVLGRRQPPDPDGLPGRPRPRRRSAGQRVQPQHRRARADRGPRRRHRRRSSSRQGQTVELPNGLGSIEFTGLQRFVSLDIHHDPTEGWVLAFALIAITGLLVSLFIPRRRVWVKAIPDDGGVRLEYAGLARGEDPGLAAAVAEIAERHQAALGGAVDAAPEDDASPEPRMKS